MSLHRMCYFLRMGSKATFFYYAETEFEKAHIFFRPRWDFNACRMHDLVHGHETHFPSTVCPQSVQIPDMFSH